MNDTHESPTVEEWLAGLKHAVDERKKIEAREETYVRAARLAGATWQNIADQYGLTRQAVHAKWAEKLKP